MINREIYRINPKAKTWKLGRLHREWNSYLLNYDGINIKAPRSHLKTFFFFEAFALRECFFNPGVEIRYFTGSDSLAIEKLDHVKDYAKLPYFQKLLAGAETNNKTELRFGNGSKIYVQGFTSKSRGGHPDFIILDDVIDSQVIYSEEQNKKSKERLAMEILPMAEPHTKIIIIGTLQKEDDLYSVDFNQISEGGSRKWISKTYDAIVDEGKKLTLFPEKWGWDALMEEKKKITLLSGEKWFDKEYRNKAVNLVGEIINTKWKKYYTELPENLTFFTGWDLSVGNNPDAGDYTAKITFGVDQAKNIYITSAFRDRLDFGKRLRAILNQGNAERPKKIGVEENVFQADTVKTAQKNCPIPIIGVKTIKGKIQKYNEELVPLFEAGKIYFKRGDAGQEIFWQELCSLPRGSHDDLADAFCIGLKLLPTLGKATDYIVI